MSVDLHQKSDVLIGFHPIPMHGAMEDLRAAWLEAESLGADRLYTSDHINPLSLNREVLEGDQQAVGRQDDGTVFEGTTLQAAMCATTATAEIGCLVHANSFRHPHMMAYIAGTLDHLSNGRFILGMGTGIYEPDYLSLDLEYGSQKDRSLHMAKNIPLMLKAFDELRPRPRRRIPLLITTMGEKIGIPLVARYADIWHLYGPLDVLERKINVLHQHCEKIGRTPSEIQLSTYYWPEMLPDANLDNYLALGITEMIAVNNGPQWDRGLLREMLRWRDALRA
jgi:alkanesulfonate monooxygenase SsuD/methylene tetrahydromethanopterin reductase-like flavin-dependent oxidoreductase (luciferase family)